MSMEINPIVQKHYDEFVAASEKRPLSVTEKHAVKFAVNNLWLMDPEADNYIVCECCGEPCTARYCEPHKQQMMSRNLCFGCNLWAERESGFSKKLLFQGTVFSSLGISNSRDTNLLGHGGRKFKITKSDGEVIFSNNVWCAGEMPWYLREKHPDNCVMEGATKQEWDDYLTKEDK